MTDTTIYSALQADSALNALVADRIYSENAPDGSAFPRVLVFKTSEDSYNLLAANPSSKRTSYQIDCFATGLTSCNAIADAVRDVMLSYGHMTGKRNDYIDFDKTYRISIDFAVIGDY